MPSPNIEFFSTENKMEPACNKSLSVKDEDKLFQVEGREGLYKETETLWDKYDARPEAVENLTLSQFATSYTKCKKLPKGLQFNQKNVTNETGNIVDHITQENLPRFIRMSTNDIYRLRKFSTVLRIHSSSKKEGEEAYFAEIQLFSPWRSSQLELWTNPEECIKEYQKRMETISLVKGKTFSFSMNVILEEMRVQETLDQVSDEVKERLDGQGAQDNSEVLDEGLEEVVRPTMDFSQWFDDDGTRNSNSKNENNKFRTLEILSRDELLKVTKSLVPEQKVVLQKVLDFAKSVVQCRNSNLARDTPHKLGLILHGGGGVGKSQTTRVCSQWIEHILRRAGDNHTKPRILLMCPTGMAASVIDGMTICSSLDLFFGHSYKGLSDQKMAYFRSEFEELKMLIIDEMSMVSADDLYKIHHRMTDIFNNNLPFGGLGIMFVGDILQLKPVKGRFIFEEPKDEGHAIYYRETSLWHSLEAITLKHNHRQGEGSKWTQTLNRFRTGEQTEVDISLLRNRCITKMSKNYPHSACHLFFTNREVHDHNCQNLNKLKTKLYEIELVGDYPANYKPTITAHGTVDDTNLAQTLKLKIGARVMVVLNINTSDSLVNGSLGVIIDIITGSENTVKCIVIKFDIEKAGEEQE